MSKFSSSFEPGETSTLLIDLTNEELLSTIRKRTWHKTVSSNNTMPSLSAIRFHGQRLAYILNAVGNATLPYRRNLDVKRYGWRIINTTEGTEPSIAHKWDSEESVNEISLEKPF